MDKKIKRVFAIGTLAAVALLQPLPMAGQNNGKELNKVITLDHDFVPVEKKAVKKNKLPVVHKTEVSKVEAPTYSNWTRPTIVPPLVPTMEPYGYRTRHHFSNQNGYLALGVGSHLNMSGSVGYRIIDRDSLRLSAWYQHNSSWNGRNNSPLVDPTDRQKQKFNDNLLGVDIARTFNNGTLTANLNGEFDSFNYYGGWTDYLKNNKQSFYTLDLGANWESTAKFNFGDIDYRAGLGFGLAGYGKTLESADNPGARETNFRFNLGGDYVLSNSHTIGADFKGQIVRLKHYDDPMGTFTDESATYGLFTLTPFYQLYGERYRATIGMNFDFSMNDGAHVKLSPAARFEFDVTRGIIFYANAGGGKELNTLAAMHYRNRYSAPNERYASYYSPLDLEAGMKFGPFKGLHMRVFVGYGIFSGSVDAFLPVNYSASLIDGSVGQQSWISYEGYPENKRYAATHYKSVKCRGFKFGGELNYRYRSLIDFTARFIYAPVGGDDDNLNSSGYLKGYSLDYYDGTCTFAEAMVKVTPIDPLSIDVGIEYRGDRGIMAYDATLPLLNPYLSGYYYQGLDDVWDLHAGASYRISQPFTVWLRASNLLNKKWDAMPGMGAQKLNIMGGVAINF